MVNKYMGIVEFNNNLRKGKFFRFLNNEGKIEYIPFKTYYSNIKIKGLELYKFINTLKINESRLIFIDNNAYEIKRCSYE